MEHELDYAIVVPDFDGPFSPNPDEVDDVRFVDAAKLEAMMKSEKNVFSPWFKLFSQFHFLGTWWDSLNDLDSHKDLEKIHILN